MRKPLNLSFSQVQKDSIEFYAKHYGVSKSQLYMLALSSMVKENINIDLTLKEYKRQKRINTSLVGIKTDIRKIGTNVNQMAKVANINKKVDIEELKEIYSALTRYLMKVEMILTDIENKEE
jgi:hypothetical protein